MICPLGVSTPQPPNYDRVELEGTGMLVLPNSLDAPLERLELGGKTEQVTTSGKNLANPSEFVIGTLAGDTGNIINLKQYITTGYIPVIPGKRYSTSCGNKFSVHTIITYDKEKTKINSPMNMSSEMPEGAAYIRLSYRKIDMTNVTESDMEELKKVCMVNEGSTVLSYEPYTGGKPSPSPEYPQEIKNVGKWNEEKQKYEVTVKINNANLLNEEDFFDMGNWKSYQYHMDLAPNTKYTFSRKDNSGINSGLFLSIKETAEGTWSQIINSNSASSCKQKVTFTTNESGKIYFLIQNNESVNLKDFLGYAQLEVGTIATQHMKYTEQPLTLTSDRPITKWDRLVEQGGEIGWLYQSKIASLTGKEEWKSSLNAFYTTAYNFMKNNEAKCSHYVLGGITNQEKNNIFSIGDGAYANSLWVRDTSFGTVQDFKAHLSDLIKKGTPITVVSSAAETEFVPLPQSEQNAIRALKTYYPTTVITVDGGEVDPDIKVTYRKEI